MFGDGKTAIRASGGIFYNFINRSQYLYNGGPLVSQPRAILNATLDELADVRRVGHAFVGEPADRSTSAGRLRDSRLHGNQLPQGKLEPEKNYQANVAFQRDIGFNTVAEVAWVGNFGRNFWRDEDDQQHPSRTRTATRKTCSATSRSTPTSSGATTRAWARSAT